MNSQVNHVHYRNTTIGTSLQASLQEFVQGSEISQELAERIMKEFDIQFNKQIKLKLKNKFSLKGQLQTYRYCDGVWILIMKDAEFRDVGESIRGENIKIIACEAPKQPRGNSTQHQQDYYE